MATPAPNILNFTGERFAPEVTGAIWYEHWHRYCVAQPLAKGLSVLDAACGEGYGSFLLAQSAKEVVGIDIAAEAIAHARARYVAPNLRYVEGSCTALPMADASIDLIVSFETIEHLQQQREMITEFRRVLVPGGVLILSSPNPPVYGEKLQSRNEYHVRELTREELADLLNPLFPHQKWYGQRVVAHSALWVEDAPRGREASLVELRNDEVDPESGPAPPMYFLVVCAAKSVKLPALPALSLFDDGKQSLYNDYTRALLREKELYWQELDARKIAEDRLGELITVTNDLASAKQQVAALSNRLIPLEDAYDSVKAELETERQYTAALTWEERNGRTIAEGRLDELITAVNTLSSERDRAEALNARVNALEETRRELETELNEERQKRVAAEWEQRNAQSIAEERLNQLVAAVNTEPQRVTILEWDLRNAQTIAEDRLKDLIAATNDLAGEREKSAGLAEQIMSVREAVEAARLEVAEERQRFAELQWEERNARAIAEERLKEAITAANGLAQERDKVTQLADELRRLEGLVETARTDLERERQKVAGLEWEERNQRTIAEERLKEAVRVANDLAVEREKIAQLTKELQAAGDARVKAEADLQLERQKIAGLEWEERDARQVGEQRLTELIEAVNALASEREKTAALSRQVASLEDLTQSLQRAFTAKHEEYEASQTALVSMQGTLDSTQQALASAHHAFASSQEALASTQQAFALSQQMLASTQEALSSSQEALSASRQELASFVASSQQELASFAASSQQEFASFVASSEQELSSSRASAQQAIDSLEAELLSTQKAFVAAHAEIASLHAGFKASCADFEGRLYVANAARTAVEAELNDTCGQLEGARWQANHFEQSAAATRAQVAKVHEQLAAVQSQLDSYKSELAVARALYNGSQADLAEVEGDLARQEWVLADVRSRLSFRESVSGWIRWPLARIRAGFRSTG